MKLLSDSDDSVDPILNMILTEKDIELILINCTTGLGKLVCEICDKIWVDVDTMNRLFEVMMNE